MRPTQIKIYLIEDQLLLRQSLRAYLRAQPALEVIGDCGDHATVLGDSAVWMQADVALLDIRLGRENSFGLASEMRRKAPALKLIWMTCIEEDYLLEEAFSGNLPGFVHKDDRFDILLEAIQTVAAGGRYYSESILARYRASRSNPQHFSRILSAREQEVLKLVGAGLSNAEAGALLGLSAGTVQAHRRNIMARLEVHSAAELQSYALRYGFVGLAHLLPSEKSPGKAAPPNPSQTARTRA